eukprot:g111.t1
MSTDVITAGALRGALQFVPARPTPGVTDDARLMFTTAGAIGSGGTVSIRLPRGDGWYLPATPTVVFEAPIGAHGTAAWNSSTTTLTVAVGSQPIAANASVVIVVKQVRTPETEVGRRQAGVQTRSLAGGLIDGISNVTTSAIKAGNLTGALHWNSEIDTPAVAGRANVTTLQRPGRAIDGPTAVATAAIVAKVGTISSASTDPTVAVAGVSKQFTFTGDQIKAADRVKFVGRAAARDYDCGSGAANAVGGTEFEIRDGSSSDFIVDVLFPHAVAPDAQPLKLCYKFGGHPYKLYTDKRVSVGAVTSMQPQTGAVVASLPKILRFVGHSIAVGDRARWITAGTSCSSNPATLVGEGSGTGILTVTAALSVNVSFAPSMIGQNVSLCYAFGSEPFKHYPTFRMAVYDVASMKASHGADTVAVAGQRKTFTFAGTGLRAGDRVRWLYAGHNCSEHVMPSLTGEGELWSQALNGQLAADVAFQTPTSRASLTLCYKFGAESWKHYPGIALDLRSVVRTRSATGSSPVAVAGYEEQLEFTGYGLAKDDKLRWAKGSDCSAELVRFVDVSASQNATEVTVASTNPVGNVDANIIFSQSSANYTLTLCYKFATEPFHLHSAITMQVAYVTDVEPVTGARGLAVAEQSKFLRLVGEHLSARDRVKWITGGTNCNSNVAPLTGGGADGHHAMNLTATYSTAFSFVPSLAGATLTMCYSARAEPFRHYPAFRLYVARLATLSAPRGQNDTAIQDTPKMLMMGGHGLSEQDLIKWVRSNTSCAAPGVAVDTSGKPRNDPAERALIVSRLSLEAASVSVTFLETGGPFYTCYKFASEPYKLYRTMSLGVRVVSSISSSLRAAESIAVANASKALTFNGYGVREGDQAFFSATATDAQSCGLAAISTVPQEVNSAGQATFTFGQQLTGQNLRLCFKFGLDPWSLMAPTIEVRSVRSITASSGASTVAVVNATKVYAIDGHGVQDGDKVKWIGLELLSCGNGATNAEGGVGELTVSGKMFSVSFQQASQERRQWQLCYKFADEPYRLYSQFRVEARGLTTFSVPKAVVGSPFTAEVAGYGTSGKDTFYFISSGADCMGGLRASTVSNVQYSRAVVAVYEASPALVLCYAFDTEPAKAYPALTLEALAPLIASVDPVKVIMGKQATLSFTSASLGVTVDDRAKWVTSSAIDCSAMDQAGSSGGLGTVVANAANPSTSTTGAFTLASTHADGLPHKLCYRFGTGNYTMFDSVTLASLAVTNVIVQLAPTADATAGTPLTFTFEGTGITTGDEAKFVDDVVALDDDCAAAAPTSGSAAATLTRGSASFTFSGGVNNMNLCFKFKDVGYKLYKNVAISLPAVSPSTSASASATASSSSSSDAAEALVPAPTPAPVYASQQQKAQVTLTIAKSIDEIPAGSVAETTFKNSFTADLSTALGIDPSRVVITGIVAGSVIVTFEILPSESQAEPLVTELVSSLEAQVADTSSALYTGSVTAQTDSTKALAVKTIQVAAPATVPAFSFNIQPYQPSGLFVFALPEYACTENQGSVTLKVVRQHGTENAVEVSYATSDGTATAGQDYAAASGTLVFNAGEVTKTILITLLDDAAYEPHFETLKLTLSMQASDTAALGKQKEATVRVFDFGDGTIMARSSFASNGTQGWTVVGNGVATAPHVDDHGLFMDDQLPGSDEYSERCDYATPDKPCDYSCQYGSPYPLTGRSGGVLELDGSGYVAAAGVDDWPTNDLTVSFWAKAEPGKPAGTIVSYTANAAVQFALYDQHDLTVLRTQQLNQGLRTGVAIDDGQWHFIAVAVSAGDGSVRLFKDGALQFVGGPLFTGAVMTAGGVLLAGQMPSTGCSGNTCSYEGGRGFAGKLQNLRVWSRLLASEDVLHGIRWPFAGSTTGLLVYWRFEPTAANEYLGVAATTTTVKDVSGQGAGAKPAGHTGVLSAAGASIVQDTPSLNSNFPCGKVYDNIWHFVAAGTFRGDLSAAYGGRLQFRLYAPSHNGRARNQRGSIALFGSGIELSFPLTAF